jgi:hypothetical protein
MRQCSNETKEKKNKFGGREQAIPIERPPFFVGEVNVKLFADKRCHVVSATDPLRP